MATQAGPQMRRHMIDGHAVLLPADAVMGKRLDPNKPLCPVCLGDGGSHAGAKVIWICGECGGSGQIETKR